LANDVIARQLTRPHTVENLDEIARLFFNFWMTWKTSLNFNNFVNLGNPSPLV